MLPDQFAIKAAAKRLVYTQAYKLDIFLNTNVYKKGYTEKVLPTRSYRHYRRKEWSS